LKPVGIDPFTLVACDQNTAKENATVLQLIQQPNMAEDWARPLLLDMVEQSRSK